MMRSFQQLYDTYSKTKDALRKSEAFSIHTSKLNTIDRKTGSTLPLISEAMSIDRVKRMLDENENIIMLFVVAEYKNLRPGTNYLFRTRGMNEAGVGPWSDATFSTFTLPTKPSVPSRPTIAQATLRTILFQWDPPDTGGSAITGYTLLLKNTGRTVHLPRSAVTYLWEGLFPGRAYYLKVQAHNEVGESEFSEWNLPSQSQTLTAAPEPPHHPRAVAGTWNCITLQTQLPYNNGAIVTSVQIEQRFIDPFQIGDWENPAGKSIYKIPEEVEVVEAVDYEQQQIEIEAIFAQMELLRSVSGGLHSKDTHKTEKEIEALQLLSVIYVAFLFSFLFLWFCCEPIHVVIVRTFTQKPHGSRIQFTVHGLTQNKLYEFRVRYSNVAGKSEFSPPSHRYKSFHLWIFSSFSEYVCMTTNYLFFSTELKQTRHLCQGNVKFQQC